MAEARKWTVLGSRTVVDDRWLRLEAQRVRTANGNELDPYYVIRERSWACVVPVCDDGRILVVEQYRHGAGLVSWELPAGDIEPGEDPAVAAARELREETGYAVAGALVALGALYPEPARNGSSGHGFVGRVVQAGDAEPDPSESITVRRCAVAELIEAQRRGTFVHAVHAAFLRQAVDEGLLGH
jgi:8-oxo-dGTP pyrophosphatase MutT (NUDIX family)